jgi:hypothetical protein
MTGPVRATIHSVTVRSATNDDGVVNNVQVTGLDKLERRALENLISMAQSALADKDFYWDMDTGPDDQRPFGPHTARIIQESRGGVIAYCHKTNAPRIVAALTAYEQSNPEED